MDRRRPAPASARRRRLPRRDARRRRARCPSRRTPRACGCPPEKSARRSAFDVSVLMPTSMTVAPGLTNSRVTNAGRPIAATRISAVRATAGKSTVREWHTVTVASRCSSSIAIGLPTMSLRPITTACLPFHRDALALEQLDAAERRARHQRRPLLHQQADVIRVKPVDILRRIDRVEHPLLRHPRPCRPATATGPGCASIALVARSAGSTSASASSSVAEPSSRNSSARHPAPPTVLILLRT